LGVFRSREILPKIGWEQGSLVQNILAAGSTDTKINLEAYIISKLGAGRFGSKVDWRRKIQTPQRGPHNSTAGVHRNQLI